MYDELIKSIHCCFGDDSIQTDCENCMMKDKREEHNYVGCCDALGLAAADAIEELSKEVDKWKAKYAECFHHSMELFEENQNLQDVFRPLHEPRWIPVTEALPECDLGAEVGNIEWISCGMVHAGCFGRGGKYRDAYFRTWTDAGEGMDAKDADYWRAVTLPEPPKEE